MKFFLILSAIIFCTELNASVIKIATGEYAPFVGENIPNHGISTMVVKAVFKEMNQEFALEFMPWKRVVLSMNNGVVVGSFPWLQNDERLKNNYYSESIHHFRSFAFMKKGHDYKTEKSLIGMRTCIPDGWDFDAIKNLAVRNKMTVINPGNAESCFSMLSLDRVDVVFFNEMVGKSLVEKMFGKKSPVDFGARVYLPKTNELYFIVSKKYPDGKKLIEDFNRGLAKIKSNGVYNSIISSKSTCGTCNQLGLL